MSVKPTIFIVILAAIGVAAVLYAMRLDQHRVAPQQARQMLLSHTDLPVDQVRRISLHRANEQPLVFERGEHGWGQVEPFSFPMDPFSIRQLMDQAMQVEVIERIDPAKLGGDLTPASLQLQPPAAQVVYEWQGGSLALNLGKTSIAGRAYMQVAGDAAILLVNQALHERALHADPKEWRDRTIFQDVGIESDRIERTDGDRRMILVRQRKTWSMIEPVKTRLDPQARDVLMQELGRARVSGFILDQPTDADLAKFGLDKPLATITVVSNGGTAIPAVRGATTGGTPVPPSSTAPAPRTQRLLIGAAVSVGSQDRFGLIEGRPAVVRIPATVLGSLFRAPENFAVATASGVQPADVKSIVIRYALDELRLERDLERWLAPQFDRTEVPIAYVDELLNQLTALKAPQVEFADFRRDLGIATITFHGFDGKAIDTVRIARDKNTGQTALENGDNVLRVFPAGLKMRLAASDFGLK